MVHTETIKIKLSGLVVRLFCCFVLFCSGLLFVVFFVVVVVVVVVFRFSLSDALSVIKTHLF